MRFPNGSVRGQGCGEPTPDHCSPGTSLPEATRLVSIGRETRHDGSKYKSPRNLMLLTESSANWKHRLAISLISPGSAGRIS